MPDNNNTVQQAGFPSVPLQNGPEAPSYYEASRIFQSDAMRRIASVNFDAYKPKVAPIDPRVFLDSTDPIRAVLDRNTDETKKAEINKRELDSLVKKIRLGANNTYSSQQDSFSTAIQMNALRESNYWGAAGQPLKVGLDQAYDMVGGSALAKYPTYTPGLNNEEIAARNQTSGEKWTRGIGKLVSKTALYGVGGVVNLLYGLGSAAVQIRPAAFYDNSFMDFMNDVDERINHTLAHYYSEEEKNMNFLQKMGTANFWANDVIGSGLSFTTGAFLTAYLTGGFGLGGLTSSLVRGGAARAASGLSGNIARAGSLLDEAAAARSAFASGAASASDVANATKAASSAIKDMFKPVLHNITKKASIGNAVKSVTTLGFGSAWESAVEANSAYKQNLEDFNRYCREIYNRNPTQEEYNDFNKVNEGVSNGVFAANMAIVGLSNFLQFGKYMGIGGKFVENTISKPIGNARRIADRYLFGIGVKAGKNGTLEAIKGNTAQKIAGTVYNVARPAFIEGFFEEGLQGVASRAAEDYVKSRYDRTYLTDTVDFIDSVRKGFADTYGSSEGMMEVGIGAIIGTGMNFRRGFGIRDRSEREKQISETVKMYNENKAFTLQQVKDVLKNTATLNAMSSYESAKGDYSSIYGDTNSSNSEYQKFALSDSLGMLDSHARDFRNLVESLDEKELASELGVSEEKAADLKKLAIDDYNRSLENYKDAKDFALKVVSGTGYERFFNHVAQVYYGGVSSYQRIAEISDKIGDIMLNGDISDNLKVFSNLRKSTIEKAKSIISLRKKILKLEERIQKATDAATRVSDEESKKEYSEVRKLAEEYDAERKNYEKMLSELNSMVVDDFSYSDFINSSRELLSSQTPTGEQVLSAFDSLNAVDEYVRRKRVEDITDNDIALMQLAREYRDNVTGYKNIRNLISAFSDRRFTMEHMGMVASIVKSTIESNPIVTEGRVVQNEEVTRQDANIDAAVERGDLTEEEGYTAKVFNHMSDRISDIRNSSSANRVNSGIITEDMANGYDERNLESGVNYIADKISEDGLDSLSDVERRFYDEYEDLVNSRVRYIGGSARKALSDLKKRMSRFLTDKDVNEGNVNVVGLVKSYMPDDAAKEFDDIVSEYETVVKERGASSNKATAIGNTITNMSVAYANIDALPYIQNDINERNPNLSSLDSESHLLPLMYDDEKFPGSTGRTGSSEEQHAASGEVSPPSPQDTSSGVVQPSGEQSVAAEREDELPFPDNGNTNGPYLPVVITTFPPVNPANEGYGVSDSDAPVDMSIDELENIASSGTVAAAVPTVVMAKYVKEGVSHSILFSNITYKEFFDALDIREKDGMTIEKADEEEGTIIYSVNIPGASPFLVWVEGQSGFYIHEKDLSILVNNSNLSMVPFTTKYVPVGITKDGETVPLMSNTEINVEALNELVGPSRKGENDGTILRYVFRASDGDNQLLLDMYRNDNDADYFMKNSTIRIEDAQGNLLGYLPGPHNKNAGSTSGVRARLKNTVLSSDNTESVLVGYGRVGFYKMGEPFIVYDESGNQRIFPVTETGAKRIGDVGYIIYDRDVKGPVFIGKLNKPSKVDEGGRKVARYGENRVILDSGYINSEIGDVKKDKSLLRPVVLIRGDNGVLYAYPAIPKTENDPEAMDLIRRVSDEINSLRNGGEKNESLFSDLFRYFNSRGVRLPINLNGDSDSLIESLNVTLGILEAVSEFANYERWIENDGRSVSDVVTSDVSLNIDLDTPVFYAPIFGATTKYGKISETEQESIEDKPKEVIKVDENASKAPVNENSTPLLPSLANSPADAQNREADADNQVSPNSDAETERSDESRNDESYTGTDESNKNASVDTEDNAGKEAVAKKYPWSRANPKNYITQLNMLSNHPALDYVDWLYRQIASGLRFLGDDKRGRGKKVYDGDIKNATYLKEMMEAAGKTLYRQRKLQIPGGMPANEYPAWLREQAADNPVVMEYLGGESMSKSDEDILRDLAFLLDIIGYSSSKMINYSIRRVNEGIQEEARKIPFVQDNLTEEDREKLFADVSKMLSEDGEPTLEEKSESLLDAVDGKSEEGSSLSIDDIDILDKFHEKTGEDVSKAVKKITESSKGMSDDELLAKLEEKYKDMSKDDVISGLRETRSIISKYGADTSLCDRLLSKLEGWPKEGLVGVEGDGPSVSGMEDKYMKDYLSRMEGMDLKSRIDYMTAVVESHRDNPLAGAEFTLRMLRLEDEYGKNHHHVYDRAKSAGESSMGENLIGMISNYYESLFPDGSTVDDKIKIMNQVMKSFMNANYGTKKMKDGDKPRVADAILTKLKAEKSAERKNNGRTRKKKNDDEGGNNGTSSGKEVKKQESYRQGTLEFGEPIAESEPSGRTGGRGLRIRPKSEANNEEAGNDVVNQDSEDDIPVMVYPESGTIVDDVKVDGYAMLPYTYYTDIQRYFGDVKNPHSGVTDVRIPVKGMTRGDLLRNNYIFIGQSNWVYELVLGKGSVNDHYNFYNIETGEAFSVTSRKGGGSLYNASSLTKPENLKYFSQSSRIGSDYGKPVPALKFDVKKTVSAVQLTKEACKIKKK